MLSGVRAVSGKFSQRNWKWEPEVRTPTIFGFMFSGVKNSTTLMLLGSAMQCQCKRTGPRLAAFKSPKERADCPCIHYLVLCKVEIEAGATQH